MIEISINKEHFNIKGTYEEHPMFRDDILVFQCNSDVLKIQAVKEESESIFKIVLRFYCSGYEIFPEKGIVDTAYEQILNVLNSK